MNIEIFDLDGTLTEEFSPEIGDETNLGFKTYSLWNLVTRALAKNCNEFDDVAVAWRKMITTTPNVDRIASSRKMTELGLSMLHPEHKNARAIQQKTMEFTHLFVSKGIVNTKAIAYVRHRLSQNTICVISTANYEDSVTGFIRGLCETNLLPYNLANKIICSGTTIDWHSSNCNVIHMNTDTNKIHGLEISLKQPISLIKPKIKAVFADDPQVNDRALLDGLCNHSFVIKNHKNKNMTLPKNCVFATWDEICAKM